MSLLKRVDSAELEHIQQIRVREYLDESSIKSLRIFKNLHLKKDANADYQSDIGSVSDVNEDFQDCFDEDVQCDNNVGLEELEEIFEQLSAWEQENIKKIIERFFPELIDDKEKENVIEMIKELPSKQWDRLVEVMERFDKIDIDKRIFIIQTFITSIDECDWRSVADAVKIVVNNEMSNDQISDFIDKLKNTKESRRIMRARMLKLLFRTQKCTSMEAILNQSSLTDDKMQQVNAILSCLFKSK